MRVGGPYIVTVAYIGRAARPSSRRRSENVDVNLGVATRRAVHRSTDRRRGNGHGHRHSPTRSSARRAPAPATSVSRDTIATLPTISDRLDDITRLTPQAQRHVVRRPGQPPEQHHGRRLLLQQLVRPRRRAGRPHRRRADLARGRRADPGERRALRRAPGQLRRRRRQHRHPQRHATAFDGVGLPPVPQRGASSAREAKELGVQPRHVQVREHRRLGVRPDREEQAVLLRQLRGREARPAGHHVPRQHRRRGRGRQRHARAGVRPRRAERVPGAAASTTRPALPGLRRSRRRQARTWSRATTT